METAILYGVGKKMRSGYLNGKYTESMVMASYNRNKKEAENLSVFGYRKYEIEKMLRECFNPLLKIKLQEALEWCCRVLFRGLTKPDNFGGCTGLCPAFPTV